MEAPTSCLRWMESCVLCCAQKHRVNTADRGERSIYLGGQLPEQVIVPCPLCHVPSRAFACSAAGRVHASRPPLTKALILGKDP